jgi:hypothetical protein
MKDEHYDDIVRSLLYLLDPAAQSSASRCHQFMYALPLGSETPRFKFKLWILKGVTTCTTLRITGFSGYVHRSVFLELENTMFRKLFLFLSSGEGGDTYSFQFLRKP